MLIHRGDRDHEGVDVDTIRPAPAEPFALDDGRVIAPGTHVLKANNTLVRKSVTFDVQPGEHVRFQCINKAHWTAMMFMAFLGAAVLTVKLVREPRDGDPR